MISLALSTFTLCIHHYYPSPEHFHHPKLYRQRNQRLNCQHPWIIEKAREFQKNIYFCFIDYAKAFDCVDHSKL